MKLAFFAIALFFSTMFFFILYKFFIDRCRGRLMNLLSGIHLLLIWLSKTNWQPFDAYTVLGDCFSCEGELRLFHVTFHSHITLMVWIRQRNENIYLQKYIRVCVCVCVVHKRKQHVILNGPTKSKLILLMIGTCCLTSTFTLQSNVIVKIICLFAIIVHAMCR